MKIFTIDVGGSSIKNGVFIDGKITEFEKIPTPKTLDTFYDSLEQIVTNQGSLDGVAISSPGAVNKKSGVIEGISAIPYIHDFPILDELSQRLKLPVSIENDANCAALCEATFGAAKDKERVVLLVLGSGVGGSILYNGKVDHGAHLLGGEFGLMILNEKFETFSQLGTAVNVGKRYTLKKNDGIEYSGQTVFTLAEQGDSLAQEEKRTFINALAQGIYNIQYSLDPQIILLGGGVSQANFLLPEINQALKNIYHKVQTPAHKPKIGICQFKNQANLYGAAVDFLQTYSINSKNY